jgi:hypothetical protein
VTGSGLFRQQGEGDLADPFESNTQDDEDDSPLYTATLADLNPGPSDTAPYTETAVSLSIGSVAGKTAVLPISQATDADGNAVTTFSQITIFVSAEDAPHVDAALTHAVKLCREHPETSPREVF